jgi:peptidoglycan/LPS O-acetylase OafA/YrhL
MSIIRFALIAGMLASILVIAYLTKGQFDAMNFYANPILLEFAAGVVLAMVWRLGFLPRSWLWLPAAMFGLALLWLGTHSNGDL